MNLPINAWLQHKIDHYHSSLRDIIVDFYMAQARLNRAECTITQLRKFNDTCLDMAELCQLNGDDQSWLHAINKLHQRLIAELSDTSRERLFRMQAWQLARHTLSQLCQQLAHHGNWQRINELQSNFMKHAAWIM